MKRNGYTGQISPKNGYLFKNNLTNYAVVIPEKYTPQEAFAAEEMKRILSLIDYTIPVICENDDFNGPKIFIGNTNAFRTLGISLNQNEYKKNGFIIETVGDDYIINSPGDTGNFYAVQTFLGHLADYTFYAVDEEKINGGDIPLKEFHIKEIPSFFGRNTFCYETVHLKDYGIRVRSDHPDFEEIYGRTFWSSLAAHTYTSDILPCEEYAKEHPDWFAFPKINTYGNLPQICFSKGLYDDSQNGFFNTFVTNLIERFIIPENDKSFFMLGIMDHDEYCECENCRKEIEKYTISGLSMRFINKVADAVEKWRIENAPERAIYLVTFAYMWLMKAPTVLKDDVYYPIDSSVVARKNVIVRIAPLTSDYRYPIMDYEHNKEAAECIKAWRTIAPNLAVWDYNQDFNSHAFIYPSKKSVEQTVNSYYENNFIDIFHQMEDTSPSTQSFGHAIAFAYAAKLWNVKENYNELYDEFIDAYYKECAENIKEYISYMGYLSENMEKRGYNGDIHIAVQLHPEYYKIEEIRMLESILKKALDTANNLKDLKLSKLLVDRIYPLTFFYKWVLLCCFGANLSNAEFHKIINDLKYNTQKYSVKGFRSIYPNLIRDDSCLDVLKSIEKNPQNSYEILKN